VGARNPHPGDEKKPATHTPRICPHDLLNDRRPLAEVHVAYYARHAGRSVRLLLLENQPPGIHAITFYFY
jgi:hypothetical protein